MTYFFRLTLCLSAVCGCSVGYVEDVVISNTSNDELRAGANQPAFECVHKFGVLTLTQTGEPAASLITTKQIWMYVPEEVDEDFQVVTLPRSVDLETMNSISKFQNLEVFGVNQERIRGISPPIRTDFPEWVSFCDAHLEPLHRLPFLREAYLEDTLITDEGLMTLAGIPTLRFVEVNHTFVTDSGIAAFRRRRPDCVVARVPSGVFYYDRILGEICGDGGAEKLEYAKVAPYVRAIQVHCGNGSKDYCVQSITGEQLRGVEHLSDLQEFDLEGAAQLQDGDIQPLYHLRNLLRLDLTGTSVSRAAVQNLKVAHPHAKILH